LGCKTQVYPEALLLCRGSTADPANPPGMDAVRKKAFGEWSFEDDMLAQSSPRLFSTHLWGQFLPAQLLDPQNGKGRLVIVVRNLKDALASLHFFRGEAKDGWLGNEHGPGSLARFIARDCPNAYGSPIETIKQMDRIATALAPSGRVHIVYYEALLNDLPGQVEALAAFLRVPLPPAKRDAVVNASTFASMKAGGIEAISGLLRKGGTGDWKTHMGPAEWAQFDAAFDAQLRGVPLAEPLRAYQAY